MGGGLLAGLFCFFVKTPIPGVESWQDYAGHCGNEIADGLARGGSSLRFLGPKPALGVSRRDLQKRLGRWLVNQRGAQW